jgi:hypothetical protein
MANSLNALTRARLHDGDSNPLKLGFSSCSNHLKREYVLSDKIAGRAVNRDESRKLSTKTLL